MGKNKNILIDKVECSCPRKSIENIEYYLIDIRKDMPFTRAEISDVTSSLNSCNSTKIVSKDPYFAIFTGPYFQGYYVFIEEMKLPRADKPYCLRFYSGETTKSLPMNIALNIKRVADYYLK